MTFTYKHAILVKTIWILIQIGGNDMATKSGRKPAPKKKTTSRNNNRQIKNDRMDAKLRDEITLLISLGLMILLFLCNFHLVGKLGDAISKWMFGVFGLLAYVAPILIFFGILFCIINLGNSLAYLKVVAGSMFFITLDTLFALISGPGNYYNKIKDYYIYSATYSKGGGALGGLFAKGLGSILGSVGTVCVCLLVMIISLVIITEKSFLNGVRNGSRTLYDNVREDAGRLREESMERAARRQELREESGEKRMNKKRVGVMLDTKLTTDQPLQKESDEGKLASPRKMKPVQTNSMAEKTAPQELTIESLDHVHISGIDEEPANLPEVEPVKEAVRKHAIVESNQEESLEEEAPVQNELARAAKKPVTVPTMAETEKPVNAQKPKAKLTPDELDISADIQKATVVKKEYKIPPISLLTRGEKKQTDSSIELKETALKLQQTLQTFGVNVTITDISKGPAVTRYELSPEVGVKVSKIVNLADDIKLALAATDIRIEAPIPGKSAVGIEVPNKENSAVHFRELLESEAYKTFASNLAFAVGKDIAGKVVVTDIAKMPHMLIAGATGSGKSVCINTIIMSILYKAKPDDVKLIMIDPKVVELSVYNGIPHLMVPVVTDPKKAAAALNWGVAEMTDRYKKFADFGVRDLKGYNERVEQMETNDGQPLPEKLPQVVIIVDELADLMMVAPGEVEESICRLAQLARAAGIHLVIATQRPSVDVITGLIKANMPSRIAFAVSSGVDSRTILDMNGAEKLLGKGDMLFYPQSMSKPARVQGAFVSDEEVAKVVDYLKAQCDGEQYNSDTLEKMASLEGTGSLGGQSGDVSSLDEHFAEAGRFIIDKDKASIGMLQRVFKIGFNRAARIMDQLCDYGVVGEEEGTKPRKVLMSMVEFENLLEEIL